MLHILVMILMTWLCCQQLGWQPVPQMPGWKSSPISALEFYPQKEERERFVNLSILFADNKYARLLKNTGIVFLGNVGSKLLTFLMLPFYTKWLSPAEYGTADLITVYTTFLFCIFSCCIQDSIFIYPKG